MIPPPPKETRVGIWVVIGVVVGVAFVAIAGTAILAGSISNERFTCPGVSWTIHYVGSSTGYFGANPTTGCLGYPLPERTGYEIAILLTLTNMAPSIAHQVTSITVASPSVLNSITPALPLTEAPGGSANITLDVTIPTLHGDYVVAGGITTS